MNVIFGVVPRPSQYDIEGMTDTWIGSFLGGDIPQLDGAADEDSDGKEDFKIPRGRRTKGKTKKSSDKGDNMSKKTDISTSREISQKSTFNPRSSERSVEHEEAEKSRESLSVDVWPQTARAIRTYSRKSISVSKSRKSPSLNKETTTKKEREEVGGVDGEGEKKKQENCRDEFRLFLSESSDSEGEIIKEGNLGSKRNQIGVCFERKTLEEQNINKTETSTARNNRGKSSECCTSVITKYFHSPDKNSEYTKRQDEQPSSSLGQSLESFEHSGIEVLPHCSKQREIDLRKSTLRKRKLTDADKKERKLSKRIASRRTSKNSDVVASVGVVSEAMADLRVTLQDISHKSTLSSKFNEAKQRLSQRSGRSGNFTVISERLNSPSRKQTLSEKRSPQLKKNKNSPLLRKRSSPKRKEERMKKYGLIPVVFEKSPKKNQTATDTLVPESNRPPTEASSRNLFSAQISRGFRDSDNSDVKLISGTGRASSRNQARVSGLFSSQSITSGSSGGTTETSRPASVSSRAMSLKSAGRSRDRSRSEMQRKGLKRKLIVDTGEKDMQSKPGQVLSGIEKKRKLSLTLSKADKPRLNEKEKRDTKTLVVSAENRSAEENQCVCEAEDVISKTQLSTENNGNFLYFDNKHQLDSNLDMLDGITCIPCSPGNSDSNDDSVKCEENTAEATSLPLSIKTTLLCSKSDDTADASVSTKSELKVPEVLSQEIYFPKERDTELFANALFNMSYPSPLPCIDERYSPPCPSSPLDAKRDTSELENRGNRPVEGHEVFTVNSSIVDEDEDEGEVSGVVEPGGMFISSLSQVNQIGYCSSADVHSRAKSSLLETGPQLGETQTQFESTSMEHSDAKPSRHIVIENKSNRFNEVDGVIEMAGESCKSHVNNSKPNATNDYPTMEENVMEREKDCKSNSRFPVPEDKSRERTTTRENESNVSASDSSPLQTCVTDFTEADEKLLTGSDERGLSVAEDNSTDFQPLDHSNLHTDQMEMEISVEDDSQDKPIRTENLHDSRVAPESHKTPDGVGKSRNYSTNAGRSVSNSFSVESSKIDSFRCKNVIAIEPLKRPPSSEELVNTLKDYGIPQCRYQQPFCSDPDDIPSCPRLVTCFVISSTHPAQEIL